MEQQFGSAFWGVEGFTLPEANMKTYKGPYKDYSLFKRGSTWVSMLVLGEGSFFLGGWMGIAGNRCMQDG